MVGQKVSQIQAVLARRCATIGELQEHLLRAGWRRKGIAKWGVLGQGEQVSMGLEFIFQYSQVAFIKIYNKSRKYYDMLTIHSGQQSLEMMA